MKTLTQAALAIAALSLGGCVGSPAMQAGLARADDNTCRSMTFQPGSAPYQNCRLSLHGEHVAVDESRRAAFSEALTHMGDSIHVSDAYSHYQTFDSDRLRTTCTTYPNQFVTTTTCN